MKHSITTLNTKKTLAASLKQFMKKKPLSKITVSEIVSDCGVNRKTFYYHFEDIFALLKWILEQEAIEVVKSFDLMINPKEAISFVIDYVDENKHIINCAYDAMGREGMKRFLFDDFIGVSTTIIDGVEKELGLEIDEDFKSFLATFHSGAIANILINYFQDKVKKDREFLLNDILLILKSSTPNILLARAKELDMAHYA